ncbi:hypothetical protein [Glutamicibacter sp.]|jgi:hypothetical protein|uniref:hypothetical protein n=1 Tax=Glutamicibacter sp. TaxID=1931995 RepID=UPI002B45B41F|nr:hypothetical protein [Glutamicibacter sp.]HJX79143.1 hypothetical protein [Glutamicibacter sp.]
MSFNLGTQFEDDEDYSPARCNAKGILRDTGSNIIAIASSRQIGLAIPTDTSGGLIKNVTYYVDYDSNFNRINFEPIFHTHTHDGSGDNEGGGRFLDILLENANEAGQIESFNPYNLSMWWDAKSLGASGVLDIDQSFVTTRFKTGTTTGSHAHGTIGGIVFEWGDLLNFQWGGFCNLNANILTRVGINVDTVTQTPDTTIRKMGMEGCDGHGTNWVVINGNGTSGSEFVTATTAPLTGDGTDVEQYALLHEPATAVYFMANRILNATSTTNVASDGTTAHSRTIRAGIKLPTGTTEKILHVKYFKLIGNTSGDFMGAWDF